MDSFFGFLTGWLLKFGKVRNTALAAIFGVCAGLAALYFQWNGHIHSLFEGAPILLLPDQIFSVMKAIYEEGTWGLRSGGNVTGIPLAIVWIVEAGIIVGMSAFLPLRDDLQHALLRAIAMLARRNENYQHVRSIHTTGAR